MPGKPRKPVGILRENGTYQASKHGHRGEEIQTTGEPRPPAWLEGTALSAWHEIVPGLIDMGNVGLQDSEALAALAVAITQHRANCRRLARNRSDAANQRLWRDSSAVLQKSMSEFGMSPNSRAKLGTPLPKQEETNPFDELRVG